MTPWLSVLIPFRAPARSWRDRLRAYTDDLWSQVPGVEVVHEDDGGGDVWNIARATNRCRTKASAPVLLWHGCDQIPPSAERLDRLRTTMDTKPWAAVYAKTREYTESQTRAILAGEEPGEPLGQGFQVSVAILAVRADVWDDVGGLDERFEGWGWEDNAFRAALTALWPDGDPVGEGVCRALWHPPQPRTQTRANRDLFAEYEAAQDMRAYLASR